ncbi:MAG: twin-arginine translocase TatA/TatE family subunit [Actinomycetota bacterium]|nr:twin-arginine translocase TatA/TatE family subunit [Actinomycetota bacterium]
MFEWLDKPGVLIVLVLALLVFGSKRLPDSARAIGRSLRILKAETKGLREDADVVVPPAAIEPTPAPVPPAAAVVAPPVAPAAPPAAVPASAGPEQAPHPHA